MSTFLSGDRVDVTVHGGAWQPGAIVEVHPVGGLVRVALEDGREVWLSSIHVRKTPTASAPATTAPRANSIGPSDTPASSSDASAGASSKP